MFDIRLPYFYNLPIAVLLVIHVSYRVESALLTALDNWNWAVSDSVLSHELLLALKIGLMVTPALTAAVYFFNQFRERNDLYLRETIYILAVVNFLGYFLPGLLP